mmetsp:Transcript_74998/g.163735  ORF Transcript_74998/g.163735 Transcript_74998/m.163735 type:complete len:122 (+) Transcript_74998:1788-2153(+)
MSSNSIFRLPYLGGGEPLLLEAGERPLDEALRARLGFLPPPPLLDGKAPWPILSRLAWADWAARAAVADPPPGDLVGPWAWLGLGLRWPVGLLLLLPLLLLLLLSLLGQAPAPPPLPTAEK